MTNEPSDRDAADRDARDFAEQALKRLPLSTPSAALAQKLLAGYDSWNARERRNGLWLRAFAQAIWPGAPVWAPASAFACALILGAGLGAVLPNLPRVEQPAFSLEQPTPFSIVSADAGREDL